MKIFHALFIAPILVLVIGCGKDGETTPDMGTPPPDMTMQQNAPTISGITPTMGPTSGGIDIRALDTLEDFYVKVKNDPNVTFIKSKVAAIQQDEATGDLILQGENTTTSRPGASRVVDLWLLRLRQVQLRKGPRARSRWRRPAR